MCLSPKSLFGQSTPRYLERATLGNLHIFLIGYRGTPQLDESGPFNRLNFHQAGIKRGSAADVRQRL
jgi:hypothetical protein